MFVLSPHQAEDQLILISTHFKMPMSAVETHLTICKALSDELQVHFPSCMVVPFGAAISGHGTLTSDCDICLITQPTERERALFSGSGYHPPGLHGHPQHDAVIDFSHLPPSSPSREDSLASSSESSSATASPTQFPDKSHGDGGSRHDFDIVASCVRRMPQCSKILTIPYAQCPIVRFTFEPPGVHCDLSINNL